jgi:uncharacterized membrane protein
MIKRSGLGELGGRIFGASAILLGATGLVFGDFAVFWQPVPPEVPGRVVLAYAAAALFLCGGLALQQRRSTKIGAIILALLYLTFTLLWSRRIIGFPQLFGTWSGTAEQLAPVTAALILFARARGGSAAGSAATTIRLAQAAFGLCAMAFGIAHFTAVKETAALVPNWLPPGQNAWVYITGVGHFAAGLAILLGIVPLLAARMLALMIGFFEALVWFPRLIHQPADHIAWAGNGVNLTLLAAAWVVADALASRSRVGAEMPLRPDDEVDTGSQQQRL